MNKNKIHTSLKNIDLNRINYILSILFIISLPFFTVVNSVLILLLTLNFIVICVRHPELGSFKENRISFVFCGLFLIYVCSFVILDELKSGYVLEKKMSLLVFPVVLGTGYIRYNSKQFFTVLLAFICAVFIASVMTFKDGYDFVFTHDMKVADSIIIRRPYFGLYVLSAVFILIYLARQYYSRFFVFVSIIGVCYFFYFAYLIYAKMAIISFIITCIFLSGYFLIRKWKPFCFSKTRIFYASTIGIVVILLIGYSVFNAAPLVRKLFFNLSDHTYNINVTSSLEIRKMIWKCVDEVLAAHYNWISGLGVRQTEIALNNCYINHYDYHQWFLEERFNAHNEFLQTWLETGLFGLTILVVTLFVIIKQGVKKKNALYLGISVFFFCCCFTESMLSVQKGIVFYSFFNSFLLFHSPVTALSE